ncbi:MAG: SET domain-containing protein-lysine N-methyltransferase [Verrucomicrobiae bacterium]|nr:SET domain-containing protein-lysine N-methyltransferase [Verrucomicrobiae bacterium]
MDGINNNLFEVRSSQIHGNGVFAKRKITAGEKIVEYVGNHITKQESKRLCEEGNNFIFELDEQTDIDGSVEWNPAKYINHSCSPNAEATIIDGHIWIVAIRDIEPGEEITFNYGYDLENYKDHPCRCGAKNCVGYIVAEELFPLVKEENKKTAS